MVARRIKWLLKPSNLPKMGKNCQIHPMARFEGHPGNIELGDNVSVGAGVSFFCHKDGSIKIGNNCYFGDHAVLHTGTRKGTIAFGSDCSLQNFSIVFGYGGCQIGNGVRIGSHCAIIPHNHIFKDPDRLIKDQGRSMQGIAIGDDVWIGAGSTVLDGCRVARGCVIAAGAVISKSVEAFCVVGGVPARIISRRDNGKSNE